MKPRARSTAKPLGRKGSSLASGLSVRLPVGILLWGILCSAPLSPGEEPRRFRVGVYENPPKIYTDDQGRVSGFHAELLEHIAEEHGWTIEFVHGNWQRLLEKTRKGAVDIMPDVAYSQERAERYTFNRESIFINWAVVYSRPGLALGSFFDLEGLTVASMEGGIHTRGEMGIVNLAREFRIDTEIRLYPGYQAAFEAVRRGEADAAVVNRIFGSTFGAEYGLERTSIIFNPVSIRYAFPPQAAQTPYLQETLDAELRRMKENNSSPYYQLLDQYMAGYVQQTERIPLWLILLLAGILTLTAILALLLLLLRMEIRWRKRIAAQLRQAKKDAEAANRAKSLFLANMTHEIRTPMNAILGYSELLQGAPELREDHRRNLETINRSGEHLLALINEVLDMSRIEAGRVRLEETVFSLPELLNQSIDFVEPQAGERGISVEMCLDPGLPGFIRSDEQKIRQILLNLLTNAVKHSHPGQIMLRASVLPDPPPRCCITVQDAGSGISPEDQHRIFEPFEQSRNPSAPREGAGLGLTISQGYAGLLGGDLWLEESSSEGSTFAFSFRLIPAQPEEPSRPAVPLQIQGVQPEDLPVKILIADDRETNRDILRKLLEPLGFTLRFAHNGREAVDLVREWAPDLLLLDIIMPEMDGVKAAAEIRKLADGGRTKIIALTASALEEDKTAVLQAGADSFLYKPYRSRRLLTEIASLLSLRYQEATPSVPEEEPNSEEPSLQRLSAELTGRIQAEALRSSRRGVKDALDASEISGELKDTITRLADSYQFSRILTLLKAQDKEARKDESGE